MDESYRLILQILSCQLFGGEQPDLTETTIKQVLKEAETQTVFSLVFAYLQNDVKAISVEKFNALSEQFYRNVILNTNNFQEHNELNDLMVNADIPYVAIKGLASAYYYPDPSLREMGDVDFLVYEKDFEAAKQAVVSAGFEVDHGDDEDSIHIAFKREPVSIWEQHRSVNGVPGGLVGELIKKELNCTIETAEQIELDGAVCRIPDKFHHGLIMILHMISHMTSEGIGLRHLCDWAVFANSIGNDEFVNLFEAKLKRFGLWKFAQIMTAVSEKYLGIEHKQWTGASEINDKLLDGVIEDILNGGNFGKKDMNRYRETKYISNRGERTVNNKSVFSQVFNTLNKKVYTNYRFINKHKILLPAGWIVEGSKYIGLLVTGKRKSKNTSAMLKEAAKRKDIYSQMDLFELK